MKRLAAALCLTALLCGGCAVQEEAPTTQPSETVELPILGAPGKNVASVVLGDIWAQYEPRERFAIYGGTTAYPVPDAPGDLELQRPEQWVAHCRFPLGCLSLAQQGAAITHLLNENLFTAAAVRVADAQALLTLAENWRCEIQKGSHQGATPQRLLLAQVGEKYLVMATGSKDYIRTFRQKVTQAYPNTRILCEEPVTA